MYSGITISSSPKLITGELYFTQNYEPYIEYRICNNVIREEVFPQSIKLIDCKKPLSSKTQNQLHTP